MATFWRNWVIGYYSTILSKAVKQKGKNGALTTGKPVRKRKRRKPSRTEWGKGGRE